MYGFMSGKNGTNSDKSIKKSGKIIGNHYTTIEKLKEKRNSIEGKVTHAQDLKSHTLRELEEKKSNGKKINKLEDAVNYYDNKLKTLYTEMGNVDDEIVNEELVIKVEEEKLESSLINVSFWAKQ